MAARSPPPAPTKAETAAPAPETPAVPSVRQTGPAPELDPQVADDAAAAGMTSRTR
jgi:hypothetical protein